MKALVVDDDKDILEYLVSICESLKIDVASFDNFDEAEAYIKSNSDIDTVIIDHNLGSKSGTELVSLFQSSHLDRFAVMISGHSLLEVLEQGENIDSSRLGFFEKPLNEGEVKAWLMEHLNKS